MLSASLAACSPKLFRIMLLTLASSALLSLPSALITAVESTSRLIMKLLRWPVRQSEEDVELPVPPG